MKDKHNVILILVSSKWFNSLFRGLIKFLVSTAHLCFSEFQVFSFISPRSSIWPLQDFNLVRLKPFNSFMLSFPIRSFSSWRLHGGSSRILFIPQLIFRISCEVKFHQAILKNKHGVKHMSCFQEFKLLHLAFWSEILSILSFEVVLCNFDDSLHVSWLKSWPKWHILNPSFSIHSWHPLQIINFFVGGYLGIDFT